MWVLYFDKLESFPTIFEIKLVGWFFKNGSKLHGSRGYFWCQISGLIFFQKIQRDFLYKNHPSDEKGKKMKRISLLKNWIFLLGFLFEYWRLVQLVCDFFFFTLKRNYNRKLYVNGKIEILEYEPGTYSYLDCSPANYATWSRFKKFNIV